MTDDLYVTHQELREFEDRVLVHIERLALSSNNHEKEISALRARVAALESQRSYFVPQKTPLDPPWVPPPCNTGSAS